MYFLARFASPTVPAAFASPTSSAAGALPGSGGGPAVWGDTLLLRLGLYFTCPSSFESCRLNLK